LICAAKNIPQPKGSNFEGVTASLTCFLLYVSHLLTVQVSSCGSISSSSFLPKDLSSPFISSLSSLSTKISSYSIFLKRNFLLLGERYWIEVLLAEREGVGHELGFTLRQKGQIRGLKRQKRGFFFLFFQKEERKR